ncbi:MAG: PorV/PorQ family protein [Elusimicrobia bacterium]|nr:PorV/PorQ family protein [Elusimicrobiota bacterium]
MKTASRESPLRPLAAALLLAAGAAPARGGMLAPSAFSAGAAGTAGAEFLKLAGSARESALGGAAAAGAQGADALFSNPAGLASLRPDSRSEASLSYDNLLESSYLGSAAWGRPLGRSGAVGAELVYFSQDAQTAYNGQGDAVGSFRPYDLAVGAAYARRFGGFAAGAGLKLIRSSVDDASGTSAAVDFGAQAPGVVLVGDRPLDIGAYVSNLGPPIKVGGASAPLPLAIVGGALWHLADPVDASFDLHLPSDQDPYVSLGVEASYRFDQRRHSAFLRLGYDQSHARELDGAAGMTAGGGLDLGSFRVDYAWVPYGDLGMQNRVTLALRF